jgi:branched-subunit amino acid transport protein AzlD
VTKILLATLAMGAVTLLCRATPFLFFMRRRPPAVLDYLQRYIPPVVMTLLVLNALKGIRPGEYPYGLPELASMALVAGLQLWRRNVLVSIGGGTALYMILIRLI